MLNIADEKGIGGNNYNDRNSGMEDEPDFTDPKGYVDEITDEELLGDWLRRKPAETDGIESVIVVDHVPEIGEKLVEKLQKVIRKIFNDFGKILNEYYPVNQETNKTKGYIFLEYQNPADALEAVKATNGYKLDKQHTFEVNLFSDFDRYADIPDEWEPPTPLPYKDHGNLHSWLQDKNCCDQYSIISEGGDRTSIMLNTHSEPTAVEDRVRWTETYVKWSPRGTYLATFHAKGIALWGGDNFGQITRFSHAGVQLIEFSPCERYMISFSPTPDVSDEPQAVIWEIFTGQKKRSFHCHNAASWPIFKWNYNGKYFARLTPNTLSVYETPSFKLLDNKSLKIDDIKDIEWSPTDNILSYWTPGTANIAARVSLIKLPSRQTVSVKNLFTVADCKMHWQKNGDYLCVKVDRYKTKKGEDQNVRYTNLSYNFNIFRMREKGIPVDIVEVKDPILAFGWEPVGSKFAYIHGEAPQISVSIHKVKPKSTVEKLKTFEKVNANHLFWSPNGQFLVLAGLRGMNGTLEFIDSADMSSMTSAEHYLATDVEWDPTGRYVVTSVSYWGHKMENAYWIWNFQGKLVLKQVMDKFCQFSWRPRPQSLLNKAAIKEVKENLKSLYPQFEAEDKMRETRVSKELREKRSEQMKQHMKWTSLVLEEYQQQKEIRMELRKGIDTDELDSHAENMMEETVEFLVNVEETIVKE